jgi:FkbM family methyltransferase
VKIIRRLAELISRGVVYKRNIKINNKKIPIYITPDAQLKYSKIGVNPFDADLINIAQKFIKPDSNVWDIGANVGVFTFACAEMVENGEVLSVEADIWLASILKKSKNLDYYNSKHIHVLPLAISDSNSILEFSIAKRGRASNALTVVKGRDQMGGVREINHVPSFTLDSLLNKFKSPHFVKIDVEGAELMSLYGAKKLINEIRPIFYIEIGKEVADKIYSIFENNDYSKYNYNGKKIIGNKFEENLFFIPNEKSFPK